MSHSPHVFAAYSVCYDETIVRDLTFWWPGRRLAPDWWLPDLTMDLPTHEVLCYLSHGARAGSAVLFAHPQCVPLVFGERCLPMDRTGALPPRIASDLALEHGAADDARGIKVLREDLEDYGGIASLALFQRGEDGSLVIIKESNADGGRQNQGQSFFLLQGAGSLRPDVISNISAAHVLEEHCRESWRTRRQDFRLRLVASVEEPCTRDELADLWDQWSQELVRL